MVTMYNCGPTVYDHFHVGNARNFVVMDVIRAHLLHRGYQVTFVQNFTDIDDKILRRAQELQEPWDHLARRFEEIYFRNAARLGIRRADVHPRATEHIPQMLHLIQTLMDKGLAYATGQGDVYYSVRSFPQYGALSGRNLDDLLEGARVDPGESKRDPLDFALWKGAKPGEPFWDTPWGAGRPGWHLECSAMSMHHLGTTIDIHSGGTDLVFPHHENECAQSCGATGKTFARYWIHNGFLTRNNEKMGKSLGNFFTIDQVLAHYEAAAVRLFLLSAHYRSPLEYSGEALDNATSAISRIREALQTASKLFRIPLPSAGQPVPAPADLDEDLAGIRNEFDAAMDDDFNSQAAIGQMFRAISQLHERRQKANTEAGKAPVAKTVSLTAHLLDRLGLYGLLLTPQPTSAGAVTAADGTAGSASPSGDEAMIGPLLDLLVDVRAEARKVRQFAIGDTIRDRLAKLGIRLQDHPTGTIWLKDEISPGG
jgi:cysteinyl-tRNA synthetase